MARSSSVATVPKKAARAALKAYDRTTKAIGSVAGLPRQWAGSLVGERNGRCISNPKYTAIADKYMQKVVNKYGEDRVTIRENFRHPQYYGYVKTFTDGTIEIGVPNPSTPGNLNTFIHECCHAMMEHGGHRDPQSKSEFEAATCARDAMDREGVPHARDEESVDVSNMIGGIIDDIHDGAQIDSRAVLTVKRYLDRTGQEPNAAFERALNQYERSHGHALL